MISELRVKYFKKLNSEVFTFNTPGITLLAGDNNSGKSTIIQAIALWQFCVQEFVRRAGQKSLLKGAPSSSIWMSAKDVTPMPLPDLKYLWNRQRTNAKIDLSCVWYLQPGIEGTQRRLSFAVQRIPVGIGIVVRYSNLGVDEHIPKVAFLPAFAGIKPSESVLSQEDRDRLIGEGLAGAVLRNVLADMHSTYEVGLRGLKGKVRSDFKRESPWLRLGAILQQVFGLGLLVGGAGGSPLKVDAQEVVLGKKGKLTRAPSSKPRDIMIEGSGFLQWLSVYTLAVRTDLDVLLLDEPDAHLHKHLQDELVFRIKNLVGNRSQVILATHSTEILGEAECPSIYWLEHDKHGYLKDEDHRRKLFLGLGGLYAPKIQRLRRFNKLLMIEGPSDEDLLRIFSVKLKGSWPSDLVIWHYKENDLEKSKYGRRSLFAELRQEIVGLKGLSIEDRDDKFHYKSVPPDLAYAGKPRDGLALRMWHRRNLENYLLLPSAIARAVGKPEDDIRAFLIQHHGFAVVGNFGDSNCYSSMALVDGKQILTTHPDSVFNKYGTPSKKVAEAMEVAEIPADVATLINDIHNIWPTL